MKTILVAGYGNIGKALCKVSQYHHMEYVFDYIDVRLNYSIEECLKAGKYNHSVNTFINLTGCTSKEIMQMCDERHINYIDTGTEVNSLIDGIDLPSALHAFKTTKLNTKAIIGAGMNPGIIEVIYAKHRPAYLHAAIELEIDSAKCADGGIFNTWSPVSFYTEYCLNDTFYCYKEMRSLDKKACQVVIEKKIEANMFKFHLVPHEEMLSILRSNKMCLLSAFLYSPPCDMCDYLTTASAEQINKTINTIPVYDNLEGEDCVGILIHDMENAATLSHYYFNSASHQKCYQKYGINGTSWQVVCGILSAIHIINLLPENKVYTMTDVAQEYSDEIIEFLQSLGFYINRKDFPPDNHFISKLQQL